MKDGESVAAKILESLGARLDAVRQETLAVLAEQDDPRRPREQEPPHPPVSSVLPLLVMTSGAAQVVELFTEHAQQVIILASLEATKRYEHYFVGTELLLGLIDDGLGLIEDGLIDDSEGLAITVMQRRGLPLEMVKAELEHALARFPRTPTDEVPFTPQAKRVLPSRRRARLVKDSPAPSTCCWAS